MQGGPLVSVLMPVYNGERYLKEAIDSILNQTYSNFELIICNDCSTDNTQSIIKQYTDHRILYFENSKNRGIVYTRNKLFSLAKGIYLSIMDCDDIAQKTKFEKQIEFLEKNTSYGICGTWAKMIDSQKSTIGYLQPPSKNEDIKINLMFQSSFVQSTVIMRKAAFNNIEYNLDFPVAEDFDLWERLSHKTNMYNIPSFLLYYRVHKNNISHEKEGLLKTKREQVIQREFNQWNNISFEEISAFISIGNLEASNKLHDLLNTCQNAYHKLILENKKTKIFQQNSLVAFLWYRYFFYCFYMKKYKAAILSLFKCRNPIAFSKLVTLLFKKTKLYYGK